MKISIDTHTHTVHSGHAYSTLSENAKFASENNIELICLTDHAPEMPGGAHSFYFFNLKAIPNELYSVKILKGVEANIIDDTGRIDSFGEYTKNFSVFDSLDFKIASLHPPCIKIGENDYTNAIINTMKKQNIDCIGHLGDPRYPFKIDEVVKFAKENNTLIEINNSSLNPNGPRYDEDFVLNIIESCLKYDTKMTFGSDAHFYTAIGGFDNIINLFEKHNIPYDNVITTDINNFLNFIKENRG